MMLEALQPISGRDVYKRQAEPLIARPKCNKPLSIAVEELYTGAVRIDVYKRQDQTNAWFVGYGTKDGYHDLAIAVVVEDSGAGSTYAVPLSLIHI